MFNSEEILEKVDGELSFIKKIKKLSLFEKSMLLNDITKLERKCQNKRNDLVLIIDEVIFSVKDIVDLIIEGKSHDYTRGDIVDLYTIYKANRPIFSDIRQKEISILFGMCNFVFD